MVAFMWAYMWDHLPHEKEEREQRLARLRALEDGDTVDETDEYIPERLRGETPPAFFGDGTSWVPPDVGKEI